MATRQTGEEHIAIVRRFFEEAFSHGDLDLIDELVADDAVGYDPTQPEPIRGADGMKELVNMYRSAFPDLVFEVHEALSDDDLVAVRWTSTGTHDGELMGIEPTGRTVTVEGVEIDRIEGGKIVESRVTWDALGVLRQIGAIPETVAP